jgi:hypothetical protein
MVIETHGRSFLDGIYSDFVSSFSLLQMRIEGIASDACTFIHPSCGSLNVSGCLCDKDNEIKGEKRWLIIALSALQRDITCVDDRMSVYSSKGPVQLFLQKVNRHSRRKKY